MITEIKVNCADLVDMVKKMSVPTVAQKDSFFFPVIAPTLHPNGVLEWVAKATNLTVWVRLNYTMPNDIDGDVRIPMDAKQMLDTLALFKGTDLITFTHDPEAGQDILTNGDDISGRTIKMPCAKWDASSKGVFESFPGQLEPETEVILFKSGTLRPNVSGSCDIGMFNDLISNTAKIASSKKKDDVSPTYHIYVDGDKKQIKTVAGNEKDRQRNVVTDVTTRDDVMGHGSLHYSLGFSDVINTLSGVISFYTVDKGPLWVMQETDRMKSRYLIPPAMNQD